MAGDGWSFWECLTTNENVQISLFCTFRPHFLCQNAHFGRFCTARLPVCADDFRTDANRGGPLVRERRGFRTECAAVDCWYEKGAVFVRNALLHSRLYEKFRHQQ